MDILHFAENLMQLRREKKITQEELADFIGVTKASVSKWENRQSLPDILLLPQLASFFDVTVDELIGYEPQLSKEQIQKLYFELSADFAALPFSQVMDKTRHLVHKYYSCYPFLLQIGTLYLNHYMLAENPEAQQQVLKEVAALCDHIIKNCTVIEVASDAVSLKAATDLYLGNTSQVIETLEKNNNPYWFSFQNDSVLIQAYYAAGAHEKAHSYAQMTLYLHLLSLVGNSVLYLGMHFEQPDRCQETIRRIDSLIETFQIDALHPNATAQFQYQCALFFTLQGQQAQALKRLTIYRDLVLTLLKTDNLQLHGDSYFDALDTYFEQLKLGRTAPKDKKLVVDSFQQSLNHPLFAPLMDTAEFQKILKGVTRYE